MYNRQLLHFIKLWALKKQVKWSKMTCMLKHFKWNILSVKSSNELRNSSPFNPHFLPLNFFLYCWVIDRSFSTHTLLFPCNTSCQKAQLSSHWSFDLLQLIYGVEMLRAGDRDRKERRQMERQCRWIQLDHLSPSCQSACWALALWCADPTPPIP